MTRRLGGWAGVGERRVEGALVNRNAAGMHARASVV